MPKDAIPVEDMCGELCSDAINVSELLMHKLYRELVEALELVILHLLQQSPANDMPVLHIEFSDRAGNISHAWWQCICYWKAHAGHQFDAVLMSYLVCSLEPGEQPSHPYEIQVRQPTRLGWQGFDADVFRSVAFRLANQHRGCSFVINSVAIARCGNDFGIVCAVSSSRCDLDEIAQIKQTEMDIKAAVDACCRKRKRPQQEHRRRVIPKKGKGLRPPKHSHLTARAVKLGLQEICCCCYCCLLLLLFVVVAAVLVVIVVVVLEDVVVVVCVLVVVRPANQNWRIVDQSQPATVHRSHPRWRRRRSQLARPRKNGASWSNVMVTVSV